MKLRRWPRLAWTPGVGSRRDFGKRVKSMKKSMSEGNYHLPVIIIRFGRQCCI